MPQITPFAAIRYNFDTMGRDLTNYLAPPYDVLDDSDKGSLLAMSNDNIVKVDLPHVPPKTAGPPECYEQAARNLQDMLDKGVLVRESRPALYVYHQEFYYEGRTYTRRKFICRARLHPFSDGTILPHEQTFGGPKEDRLALMKATECNLSAIFGLYADPHDEILSALDRALDDEPDATANMEGVVNRFWVIEDDAVIAAVVESMAGRRIYIADGHHRYGTALLYRDWLMQQNGGNLSADHPANYVMFVLASMDDPGCLILPYYRVLPNIDEATILAAWSAGVKETDETDADVTLFNGQSGEHTPLAFTARARLAELEPNETPAWRKLDYAYLHRYLIDGLLRDKLDTAPTVHYVKSLEDAKSTARRESGVALLMKATPMAHLRAVSEAGGLMPQKSTYFYPKLATGLTINPLS